jgi:hypothetical protein
LCDTSSTSSADRDEKKPAGSVENPLPATLSSVSDGSRSTVSGIVLSPAQLIYVLVN